MDTNVVANMRNMFKNCASTDTVNLTGFDTSSIKVLTEEEKEYYKIKGAAVVKYGCA